MGFRSGSYATVWGAPEVKSETCVRARISTSKKARDTGEYTQDFSGFVTFLGTAAAKKAAGLKEKDRIKLGDVDVTTTYIADRKTTYTNYSCFSFEMANDANASAPTQNAQAKEVEINEPESDLPF